MSEPPVLEVEGVTVRYGLDAALDEVSFRLFPGEVHSLMGENGAGKSTLVKVITGALRPDAGVLRLDGRPVRFGSPADAARVGIQAVYQEIDLLPNLSVAENIALGREPRRRGLVHWQAMRDHAAEMLAALGVEIDPASRLGQHSLAVQQLVAIARAISAEVRVLVLDEPTSSLDIDEVAELFRVVRELQDRGVAILFVSHFLDQVYELCDRLTVLRDGRLVGEYLTQELLRIDLVEKMLGRPAEELARRRPAAEPRSAAAADQEAADESAAGAAGLVAQGLHRGRHVLDAELRVGQGEVVGFAGLLGSGRTELARALSGVDQPDAGVMVLDGRRFSPRTPRQAIGLGVVYSSENRKAEGIIAELTVRENIVLALQAQRGIFRRLRPARQRELAASWIEALDIRPAAPERRAGSLSGGNQQKVLLARLLALAPRVLLLDEPTRGIDVGAKVEVQNLVGELADNGMSVVFISSELEEVLRVANRVTVLRDGRVVAAVPAEALSGDALFAMVIRPDDD